MFADHQPIIAAHGRSGAMGFRDVTAFMACTVQVPIEWAAEDTRHYLDTGERRPRTIFGAKHACLDYLDEHAGRDLAFLERFTDPCERLAYVVETIPGIGLAKGGFLMQCLYGQIGCLDRHNLGKLGIANDDGRFNVSFKRKRGRFTDAKVSWYVDLCSQLGTPETLWDNWCEYVATMAAPGIFLNNADKVSALHLCCTPNYKVVRLAI